MKKTIGGDRLGAGKKMTAELHNYSRSTHDLSYLYRTTMSAGTLVPFLKEVALPGDSFDIDLRAEIMTHPTVGPLFGSFKVQLDVFQCPIRLYQGQLHNNKLGIGMKMANVKLPVLKLKAPYLDPTTVGATQDITNSQINPSCILNYLGIRGIGWRANGAGGGNRTFNGVPLLAYWDIYKNYYSNKQEEIGAVIHSPTPTPVDRVLYVNVAGTDIAEWPTAGPDKPLLEGTLIKIGKVGGTIDKDKVFLQVTDSVLISMRDLGAVIYEDATEYRIIWDYARYGENIAISWRENSGSILPIEPIKIETFDLSLIDDMREKILAASISNLPFDVFGTNLKPYNLLVEENGTARSIMGSQEGLGLKTYQSDLFNNWLQTEWIDGANGISEITAIDTSEGNFTIDTLNLSQKVYAMLNRIAISGGTYDDWLDAVYTHDRYTKCESPMYMGGLIKELVFQEVISNAAVEGAAGNQPLGQLAGRGVLGSTNKGGHINIKVDEPSYLIGIISLTPRLDYSQGNTWDTHLMTMDDLHKPALDEIGFQELITEQMAWWDTHENPALLNEWEQKSAGKQPAWINYMTNVNKVYGNFAQESEGFMVLNRRYEHGLDINIKDLTTYIDPRKFNHIFADTALDSQNFWTQISVNMTARRKLSAKLIPNL